MFLPLCLTNDIVVDKELSELHMDDPQEELREPTRLNVRKNHPIAQIIGNPSESIQTRSSLKSQGHNALISEVEPKHIDKAMQDEKWVKTMQEELDQFQKNDIWKLVAQPKDKEVAGVKWVWTIR